MDTDRDSDADVRAIQWARRLGEQHYDRDECTARTGKADEDNAALASAASLDRWQEIAACIRRLADGYNTGAKRAVLSVVEQPGQSVVTVAASGEGAPYLTAVLEGTFICSHGRDAGGVAHVREVRLQPGRDNDATAAYLLQDWMQRL